MIDDSNMILKTTYSDVANSFLHRIVARPRILPYIDMVLWVVENLSSVERKIVTISIQS